MTRGVINEALHMLACLREQSDVRDLRGRLHWEGDLAMLRESRTADYEVMPEAQPPNAAG